MKAVILAGGLGTRLSEETHSRPKPMVEIGGKPILWHIMKSYSAYGINEFIICCGYKGYMIKEYFNNYFLHNSDVSFSLTDNSFHIIEQRAEPCPARWLHRRQPTSSVARIRPCQWCHHRQRQPAQYCSCPASSRSCSTTGCST